MPENGFSLTRIFPYMDRILSILSLYGNIWVRKNPHFGKFYAANNRIVLFGILWSENIFLWEQILCRTPLCDYIWRSIDSYQVCWQEYSKRLVLLVTSKMEKHIFFRMLTNISTSLFSFFCLFQFLFEGIH